MKSSIETSEVVYARLQALVWPWSRTPPYDTVIPTSVDGLAQLAIHCGTIHKPLVLNCRRITRVMSHALKPLVEVLQANPDVVVAFYDVDGASIPRDTADEGFELSSTVAKEFDIQLSGITAIKEWGDIPSLSIFGSRASHYAPTIRKFVTETDQGRKVEDSEIRNAFVRCYQRFPKPARLTSTPLLAGGMFRATRIIREPAQLSWTVLRLADQLEQILDGKHGPPPQGETRLLACSRNGAALAFCLPPLAHHLGIEGVDIVDRLGPAHCFVEDYAPFEYEPINSEVSYIYIGDFVVGGTELRAASAHAQERRRHLTHALCLGSVLPAHCYSTDYTLVSLVELQSLGLDLHYSLT